MKIPLPLLSFGLLLAVKLPTKFAGVSFIARRFMPREAAYATLLMSTGLPMGMCARAVSRLADR